MPKGKVNEMKRKLLKNRGVQCCVRVRPILPKDGNIECAVSKLDDRTAVVTSPGGKASGQMQFDKLFDGSTTQVQLFEEFIKPAVKSVMDGFNGTIFAYGQSSSGKTTTMVGDIGDEKMEGVIPRVVTEFYNRANQCHEKDDKSVDYLIHCSVLEIYNEKIRDLYQTDPKKAPKIRLRERRDGTVHAEGATQKVCLDPSDMMQSLQTAFDLRVTGSTNKNHVSSRSHLIITLVLESKTTLGDKKGLNAKKTEERKKKTKKATINLRSRLNLVDLAGSESLKTDIRGGKHEVTEARVSETLAINTSLRALARVITALSKSQSHIPYRDSVLTRLLQDSLGGNSLTQMIACVSPCPKDTSETISAMRYAMFARKIKNVVFKDQDPKDMLLEKMQQSLKELRVQLEETKKKELTMKAAVVNLRERNRAMETAAEMLLHPKNKGSQTLFKRCSSDVVSNSAEGQNILAKMEFMRALTSSKVDGVDESAGFDSDDDLLKRRPLTPTKKKRRATISAHTANRTWTEGEFLEALSKRKGNLEKRTLGDLNRNGPLNNSGASNVGGKLDVLYETDESAKQDAEQASAEKEASGEFFHEKGGGNIDQESQNGNGRETVGIVEAVSLGPKNKDGGESNVNFHAEKPKADDNGVGRVKELEVAVMDNKERHGSNAQNGTTSKTSEKEIKTEKSEDSVVDLATEIGEFSWESEAFNGSLKARDPPKIEFRRGESMGDLGLGVEYSNQVANDGSFHGDDENAKDMVVANFESEVGSAWTDYKGYDSPNRTQMSPQTGASGGSKHFETPGGGSSEFLQEEILKLSAKVEKYDEKLAEMSKKLKEEQKIRESYEDEIRHLKVEAMKAKYGRRMDRPKASSDAVTGASNNGKPAYHCACTVC